MGSLRETVSGWLRGGRRGDRYRRERFADLFGLFQQILKLNNDVLDQIADMGSKLGGSYIFDQHYIHTACSELSEMVYRMINDLNAMSHNRYMDLYDAFQAIEHDIQAELAGRVVIPHSDYTIPYRMLSSEFAEVTGAKNANLAEVHNQLGLPTPDGFAITTSAFQAFMEYEGLGAAIAKLLGRWRREQVSEEEAESRIRALVMAARLPHDLEKAIRAATEKLLKGEPPSRHFLALRSSAIGEDGEHSFAGQFDSIINLPAEKVVEGYKEVVAGLYSAQGLAYRQDKGFADHEVTMAVGCQLMVHPRVSGVMYTLDPRDLEREVMLVSAAWGLGGPVVAGEVLADQYLVERKPPHQGLGLDIVHKKKRLVPRREGGTVMEEVPRRLQSASCLNREQVKRLAEAGLALEKHFKKPQDVEWALDDLDRLFILQTRPLNLGGDMARMVCDISQVLDDYPVIFHHLGSVAQGGIGTGPVFMVESDEDLDRFPDHAVLVTRQSSPRMARVMRRAAAVLTDLGTPTGHMATIAREYRIPTIVGTEVATSLLKNGQEITVDARQNVIYEGTVKELCYYELSEDSFEEMYEYRLLRRVLRKIAPLHLIDASSPDFTPAACTTFHDIVRFIHEKAVQELIHGEYLRGYARVEEVRKRLKCGVPLSLVLIDLGDGLDPEAEGKVVEAAQLRSLPMRAFIQGLVQPGLWSTESVAVDFKSFMSSMTRTFSFSATGSKNLGQNLAVISKEYANISLRLGYHFTMIDAYISDNVNDNHVYFRFLGGVTDVLRRSRRARLLEQILDRNDFRVDVRGDLVVGRTKKLPRPLMEAKMRLLGYLVAYTRQLDVKMVSDQEVDRAWEEFNRLQEAIEARLGAEA